MRWSPAVLFVIGACTSTPQREQRVQEVLVYRACEFAAPGELIALPRNVQGDLEPVAAAIGELVRGVTDEERDRGCRSFFSSETESALKAVRRSAEGDTVHVDFRDFSSSIPSAPGVRSFLPPGVMAELTWTIFHQFPEVEAVHFSFDGDQRAFWNWVGDEDTEPQAFTRSMWERV